MVRTRKQRRTTRTRKKSRTANASEDGKGKKSVTEELPWIREALKAVGLDVDGNELLPPEPEHDY